MQMTYKDIPIIKEKLIKRQKYLCKICKRDLTLLPSRDVCLDHNHQTGMVRSVLCRQCNALEGKVYRSFIRVGAKNKGIEYKSFIKGLLKFIDIKDTVYKYPIKHKRKKKK